MAQDGPLHFCIVSTFYPPFNFGGDGIYAHRLANGLARLGHRVTVLHSPTAYEMLASGPPKPDYDDHTNVRVHPIRTPLGSVGLLAVQQTGRPCTQGPRLRALLDRPEAPYDVIHYNNVSLLGGPHAFRLGRGLKLCTLIEHWLVCPMHVLWRMGREVCTRPTCVRCTLHGRRPPQWWRYTGLMRRATRHIDAFIGPSLFTMNMHAERGIRGTMIQLPLFHPEPPVSFDSMETRSLKRPYFLFVGRLERIKGVQEIIPIFKSQPEVELVIAGAGDYEAALREFAAGADNVRFVGRLPAAELQRLYREAVATIVPSLCYETFGVVVVESYSTSTPVIVYGQSSLQEIVETHGGGIVYRSRLELEAAMERLLKRPNEREQLGAQGRSAYEAEFSESAFMGHYLDAVYELLEAKRAGRLQDLGRASNQIAGRRVLFAGE